MKIVVLDGNTLNPGDLSWDGLKKLGEVTVYERTPREKVIERIGDAQIVLTNKTEFDKEIIDKLKSVKYIGVLATGYNVVDVKAAKEKGIIVTNVPAYSTTSVAQLTFALLLEICQNVGMHNSSVKKGDWVNSIDFCYWKSPLIELAGKTFGIIGLGKIGTEVAKLAKAFGMNVIAYTRTPRETNIKLVSFDELISQSDIISLHCPLTKETKGMIDKDTITRMKDGVIILNTSRGPLLVEEDLAKALSEKKVYAAGVDVLSNEPPKADNPLLDIDNCIITPHIAWASKEARIRLLNTAIKNVESFINNNPINVVNK